MVEKTEDVMNVGEMIEMKAVINHLKEADPDVLQRVNEEFMTRDMVAIKVQ